MKGSIDLTPVHCSAEGRMHREITFLVYTVCIFQVNF